MAITMPIRRKFIDANRYPTHKFFVPTNIYDIIVMTDQNSVTSEEPRVVIVILWLNRPNILFNQIGIEACVSI
jgi:hypothetical protein